ncbi:MAG: hypothetical protein HC859_07210 [Bacteroidia bacterium]|nr:hypothetical protein [Bacteroidia bacterium]
MFNAFLDNIIRLIRSKQEADNTALYDCLSTPGKAEEIASIMVHNWEMAHQLVTANGGEFIAILQPAAFIGSPKVDHLKFDEAFRKNFMAVYDHIRKILSEKNYPWVVDMTKAFDHDEYIYIDFCHVSPNGNALIVDTL